MASSLICVLLQVVKTEQRQFEKWVLTVEGSEIVEKGSHEARLFNTVDAEKGSLQTDLMVREGGMNKKSGKLVGIVKNVQRGQQSTGVH